MFFKGFFEKGVVRRIHKKTSAPGSLFWCFGVNFAKFAKIHFSQNSTGRLFLIIAVTIIAKGVLSKETVIMKQKLKHIY